jgi:hypothetical protein
MEDGDGQVGVHCAVHPDVAVDLGPLADCAASSLGGNVLAEAR